MRRREYLAALGCGAGALAGCPGRADSAIREDVTPAPVPTPTEGRDWNYELDRPEGCPQIQPGVERALCGPPSVHGGPALELAPDRRRFVVDTDQQVTKRMQFVLTNRAERPFATGGGRWALARRQPGRWTVVDWGSGEGLVSVQPGDRFVWTLGTGGSVDRGGGHHDVVLALDTGRYAFGIDGMFDGQQFGLVAIVAVTARQAAPDEE